MPEEADFGVMAAEAAGVAVTLGAARVAVWPAAEVAGDAGDVGLVRSA